MKATPVFGRIDLDRGGLPVDVLELQPDNFAGPEAIDAHHQQQCVVAQASRRGCIHRAQQASAHPPKNARRGRSNLGCTGDITDSASSIEIRPVASRNRAKERMLPAMSATVERAYRCAHPIRKSSISVSAIVRQVLPRPARCSKSFPIWANFLRIVTAGCRDDGQDEPAYSRRSADAGGRVGRGACHAGTTIPITR